MPSELRDDRAGELAAYLLDALDPEERASFEELLAEDEELRAGVRELTPTVLVVEQAADPFDFPEGLAERTLAYVESAMPPASAHAEQAVSEPPAERPVSAAKRFGWSWPRRFAVAGALALSLAVAVVAGSQLSGDDGSGGLEPGELELSGTLVSADGTALGSMDVVALGIGRRVEIASNELEILPKDEFYEVWFVAPGDSRAKPNRISAGTFHPDEQGRSNLELKAAVDPALYPVVEITAEPGDGDPRVGGPVVATLDSD